VVGVHGRAPFEGKFLKWKSTLTPPAWVEFGERNFALSNIWRSASGSGLAVSGRNA
jgi:hypothetical protein